MKNPRSGKVVPPWLFLLVTLCYFALLFHLWTLAQPSFGRIVTVAFFTLAWAGLFALPATISRVRGVQTAIALVLAALWGVLFLVEYFVRDSFQTFMPLRSLLGGAGNAGQADFSARMIGLLGRELWRVGLYVLPFLAWPVLNRLLRCRPIPTAGLRRYLAIAAAGTLGAALLVAAFASPDTRRAGEAYEFDAAVHAFGLPAAVGLDLGHSAKSAEVSFLDEATGNGQQATGAETEPVSSSTAGTDVSLDAPETTEPSATVGAGVLDGPPETTEPTETEPPAPEYNVMDLDLDTRIETESSDALRAIHQYVASVQPSQKNEMTGLFAGKNLIFITAEGFAAELIDPERTPTLYRLAHEGIYFTDYYQPAWGGSTSTGEYSNLVGLYPAHGVDSIQDTVGHEMYFTLGNQLRRLGYFSRAYHNNSYTYYKRHLTHENLGYDRFIGMGNGMEQGVRNVWPGSDREMIDFTVPQYIDNQPFSVYYMTVSGHGLYSWMGNTMSYEHKAEVEDLDCSDRLKAFYACNLELEYAMADLVAMLEEAGIADDTVIVLGSDHYPYCLEKSATWENDRDYLSELYGQEVTDCFIRDHNALILWSGCLEGEGIEVTTPTYSLDIVPTLSNLFGLEYDSRLLVGRDVFSDREPLVFWPDRSWKTGFGTYNGATDVFTPAEGVTVTDEDVQRVHNAVANKIRFSDAVLNFDYYRVLFD